MRLGIEASNIRAKGGLTHLVELLAAADPPSQGFVEVVVRSGQKTIDRLPSRTWLRTALAEWRVGVLRRWDVKAGEVDLLFVPGGRYLGPFRPFVTMVQNLLPFQPRERRRYGISLQRLRLHLLEHLQTLTVRRASGVVVPTETVRSIMANRIGGVKDKVDVIPHGISQRFFCPPRIQRPLEDYSWEDPFTWLYVSSIDPYKHQWNVVKAVGRLLESGIPVRLELVGPARPPHRHGIRRLKAAMESLSHPDRVRFRGFVPHEDLPSVYTAADGFVFASTCESISITLLEAMASGLPILSSNRSPLTEIVGKGALFFDPESPASIEGAMVELMDSRGTRTECAEIAYTKAGGYSWEKAADETFGFLAEVARRGDTDRRASFLGR